MLTRLRDRASNAVNGRLPRLSWDLWGLRRDLAQASPSQVMPAIRNQVGRRRGTCPVVDRPTTLLLVVPSDDHQRISWAPAEGNYSFELQQTAAACLGADAVATIRIEAAEATSTWHRHVVDAAQDLGATHLLARIDVEANGGAHWSWDELTRLLRRHWDGVFLPLSYDSAYPYVSMHLDRIGRLDHRAVPVVLDRPIEGVIRPRRPAAGPLFLPLSDASTAAIDRALEGNGPEFDLTFIGNVDGYPYRKELLAELTAEGVHVTVNPHGRSNDALAGFTAYAGALRRSRVTLNFTRCNGVPVTQLKTRMLEGSLFGAIVAADSPLYAADYFQVGEEFLAYSGPRDLHTQLDALLADEDRQERMRTSARARADVLRVRNFWERIEATLRRRAFPLLGVVEP